MYVVTGDDTGLVKLVSLKSDGTVRKFGVQSQERGGVQAMRWAGNDLDPESHIALALGRGGIEVWDARSLTNVYTATPFSLKRYDQKIIGMDILNPKNVDASERRFLVANSMGNVKIIDWDEEQAEIKFDIGDNLERLVLSPDQSVFVAGGTRLCALWDVETQQQIFKSKNANWDEYKVIPRYYDLAYAFVPPTADGGDFTPNTRFLSTNEYKQLRLYDTKAGQRPVWSIETSVDPIHSLAYLSDGYTLITGDAGGRVQRLDMRYPGPGGIGLGKLTGVYRGGVGSVRSIAPHPTLPFMAVAGLDRHLRVYQTESRELLKQVYLTQKLTACLFSRVEYNRKKARMTQKAIEKAQGIRHAPKTWGEWEAEQEEIRKKQRRAEKAARKAARRNAALKAQMEAEGAVAAASESEASKSAVKARSNGGTTQRDTGSNSDSDSGSEVEVEADNQISDDRVWDEFEKLTRKHEKKATGGKAARKHMDDDDNDADDAEELEDGEYEYEYEQDLGSKSRARATLSNTSPEDENDGEEEELFDAAGEYDGDSEEEEEEEIKPAKRKQTLTKSLVHSKPKKSIKLTKASGKPSTKKT